MKVFFAYQHDDEVLVAALRDAVQAEGADVLDPGRDLAPGSELQPTLDAALRSTDVFVFLVPPREGAGKSALIELGAARALGKRIVALLPDRSRASNAEVAVRLADIFLLDAARRPPREIARAILAVPASSAA